MKESTKTAIGVFVAGLLGMVIGAAIFWGQVAGRVVKPRDVSELESRLDEVVRAQQEMKATLAPLTPETGMWWCAGEDFCYRSRGLCETTNSRSSCTQHRIAYCEPVHGKLQLSRGFCQRTISACARFSGGEVDANSCIGVE